MVKKQQMHWAPHGARLLLLARTRACTGRPAASFRRWHSGFNQARTPLALAA